MLHLLFTTVFVQNVVRVVKEKHTPVIPAENWENKELYYEDLVNGVSAEQRLKYAEKGKYKLGGEYPEPHRDPKNGKIIIENCKLYHEDIKNYGTSQAKKWVMQGKYNLTPEELEKQHKEYEEKWKHLYGKNVKKF